MKNSILLSKYRNFFIIIFWITVWEILSLIINQEIYLPSPFATFKSLFDLMFDKVTYITILYSTYRTLTGFLISTFFGVMLGFVCGMNKSIYNLLNPLVSIIRTVPVMSIIIIAIMWFKDTNVPVFVAFLMCFPIIWTNTIQGIDSADNKLLQMCKIYNIKKIRVIKSVYFYSALPYIKAGMVSALGISWKVTSAAEVLSLPKYSIGRFLYDSKVYLEIPDLFAWTIIIVLLSILFEKLLNIIFKAGRQND
ncbi:Bicarbonate transport system permease protein CmpB [bioreactor metagenome]|uniref:Bicarbonate transport system permease protein CmpB n=1 Tax=bioreactor metagenome TaxID=1076179 RepID=A0A644Y2G4_9ZZZZ|nr:ABC transporter permease subunit [Sedimentibacter saalensis]MEA5094802.1 ABC transporter permease subunit [Sedimentibacter saalensis]